MHVAVELYADILAVYARAFRGETRGARAGNHNQLQENSVRGGPFGCGFVGHRRCTMSAPGAAQ